MHGSVCHGRTSYTRTDLIRLCDFFSVQANYKKDPFILLVSYIVFRNIILLYDTFLVIYIYIY